MYDLSGTYRLDQDIIGAGGTPVPLSLIDLPLTQDRNGRLQGTGMITAIINDTSFVGAAFTASGRVSGGGDRPTRVRLTVRLRGTGFNMSVRYDFEVDSASMSLVGTAKGNVSYTKLSGKINSDIAVPLPPGVDGLWSVQMDVVPLSRLGGSGNIVLSNGRVLPMKLAGSFSQTTRLSKVQLSGIRVGDNDGRGNSVKLNFFTGAAQPDLVKGTILGQKVLQ